MLENAKWGSIRDTPVHSNPAATSHPVTQGEIARLYILLCRLLYTRLRAMKNKHAVRLNDLKHAVVVFLYSTYGTLCQVSEAASRSDLIATAATVLSEKINPV